MDNVVLTATSQISPTSGHPLNSEPMVSFDGDLAMTPADEPLMAPPFESVDASDVDGNCQAHIDVNYQAHDVALADVTSTKDKVNVNQQPNNGFALGEHHKMEIDDAYEHPNKVKSCCSMLNRLFLASAIACFALFLCSIAFIVANIDGVSSIERRLRAIGCARCFV
jgi:hypothetical protein